VNSVCEEFFCTEEQIITKGRKKNKARQVAIYLASDMSAMSWKGNVVSLLIYEVNLGWALGTYIGL
jgi:hypothetical protein